MPSLTIENYVKTIYQLCADNDNHPALTGKVAAALSVSPGTVTSMLKTLSDSGLARLHALRRRRTHRFRPHARPARPATPSTHRTVPRANPPAQLGRSA